MLKAQINIIYDPLTPGISAMNLASARANPTKVVLRHRGAMQDFSSVPYRDQRPESWVEWYSGFLVCWSVGLEYTALYIYFSGANRTNG